jgi:hypothetical protein
MTAPERHAERFLAAHGLTADDLAACIPEIPPGETVFLTGSVSEGLANRESDIDLLVLGDAVWPLPRRVHQGPSEIAYSQALHPLKLQIERVPFNHLEVLAARMAETVSAFHDPAAATRFHVFPDYDVRILHRVRTGLCLRHPEAAAQWRERLCCSYLPHYMMLLAIGQHFNRREDAIGEAREGRSESAVWVWRDALSFLACALLGSIEETHPYSKWWIRLLQLRRDEAGADLADGLIERLTKPVWGDVTVYLRDAIDFADTVISAILIRRAELLPVLQELLKDASFTTYPSGETTSEFRP